MSAYAKYRNQRYRGYASKREAELGANLHALANAGEITDLQEQVRFVLVPAQEGPHRTELPVTYVADFVYDAKDGHHVIDAKGFRTREYVLKRKLMLYRFGIEIEEL